MSKTRLRKSQKWSPRAILGTISVVLRSMFSNADFRSLPSTEMKHTQMESANRSKTYDIVFLSDLFNDLEGYYELNNFELGQTLQQWNLLDDNNRKGKEIVSRFMKWSFTASFLQLLNAWQWFLAGILLGRQAYMPAQVMQMYYYSIFFSYGAFLAAQFKGHYSLKVEIQKDKDIKKTRKEVWIDIDDTEEPCICIKDKGRGGEHEIRAKWFYEVFRGWDLRNDHPEVSSFENDRNFHVSFRNMYTYSLSDIGEEFYYGGPEGCPTRPSNEILLDLWRRQNWIDFYPEEYWALEHLKVALNLHMKLLESYNKKSPYTDAQTLIIRNFYRHHEETGLATLIQEAMNPILTHVGICK